MAKKQPSYPMTPESPRGLLKIALSHGYQSTSRLLTSSVLGTWVVALIAYMIQAHLKSSSLLIVLGAIVLVALVLAMLIGVVQTDAAYQQKKCNELAAIDQVMKHAMTIIACLVAYALLILVFSLFAAKLLPHIFALGSITLGVTRLILGCGLVFAIISSFLVLVYRVISKAPFGELLSHTFSVSMRHWFRTFLCFISWLLILDLLNGDFAIRMIPILQRIPYAPIVVITVVAVLAVPVLVTYTTLFIHDLELRYKRNQ
jgi:NADH:ubiquinone oxidoreductase subunit 3 (subunit A)